MLQVTPDYKIQLVSCKLSPKSSLGLYTLEDIHDIYAYIFCDCFCSVILLDSLSIFINLYAKVFGFSASQWTLFSEFSGFRKSVIQWSSDTYLKRIFGFWLLRSVRLFLGLSELKDDLSFFWPFSFIFCLKIFQLDVILHNYRTLSDNDLLFL